MRRLKKLFVRYTVRVSYALQLLMGRVFGISHVVRYLRNPNPKITVPLLRAFGATIGTGATIKGSLSIDNAAEDANSTGDFSHLRIGDNCYIGDAVYLDLANRIDIEDDVVISGRVAILTHADCNRSQFVSRCYPRVCRPVRVGAGAWLGFDAVLSAGSTVGGRAVIGGMSFVRENIEAGFLYAGTPAKKIRKLEVPSSLLAEDEQTTSTCAQPLRKQQDHK